MTPIIFLRVAWMKQYKGKKPNDKPEGGGKYIEEYGDGGEVYNYLPENGICYGYTRPNSIDILRLQPKPGSIELKGVTVVWFATHPLYKGQYIVGWYRNANIYKNKQQKKYTQSRRVEDYIVSAKAKDCKLIREEERVFEFNGSKKPGHNFVWFGHEHLTPKELKNVFDYIKEPKSFLKKQTIIIKPKIGGRYQMDIELRKKIETKAIEVALSYYETRKFFVKSVEKENKGWDIEATKGSTKLHIEVKGSQGNYAVELTPNEYKYFKSKPQNYCLFIVQNALTKKPVVNEFFCHKGKWTDYQNNSLEVKQVTAARITII